MNYAVLMLVVLSIWMILYFVVDDKIESLITKVDVATLLILGILFIVFWLDVRYRQGSVLVTIWSFILYVTILINMIIKGFLFMRNRKIHSKGNDLSHRKVD